VKEHPCKDCLLKPICKYKEFFILTNECKLVARYLYFDGITTPATRKPDFNKRVELLKKCLLPTEWLIIKTNPKFIVNNKESCQHIDIFGKV
jgi:hypothetical protein